MAAAVGPALRNRPTLAPARQRWKILRSCALTWVPKLVCAAATEKGTASIVAATVWARPLVVTIMTDFEFEMVLLPPCSGW
eukprot:4280734-Amphidinium_carterae.3